MPWIKTVISFYDANSTQIATKSSVPRSQRRSTRTRNCGAHVCEQSDDLLAILNEDTASIGTSTVSPPNVPKTLSVRGFQNHTVGIGNAAAAGEHHHHRKTITPSETMLHQWQ